MKFVLVLMSALSLALVGLAGCSSSSGGGSASFASGWMDNNGDGVYDPYQEQALWDQMMLATGGATALNTGVSAGNQEQNRIRHQWRDQNQDGVCDYAQYRNQWRNICRGDWIDDNGDGICDNYPGRSTDGQGRGWNGGWR